jgi:ribonuclease T1
MFGLTRGIFRDQSVSQIKNIKLVLAGLCFAAALVVGQVQARAPSPIDVQTTVSLGELPRQGQQIYTLIFQGGPFATEKDGVVFGNRERLLPGRTRGYYREYTVPTPGLNHRGVKRIVCGGKPRLPDVCYYTADHYASFRKIVP